MIYRKDEQLLLENCEDNWPKVYYEENDRQIRSAMLEKIQTSEQVKDDLLTYRKQIWEARYGQREKQSSEIDYFVRGIMTLKSILIHANSLFGIKKCNKILAEAKEDLGINLYTNGNDAIKEVLVAEWSNLADFYYKLCVEDRNFSTGVLGVFKLKDDELSSKIADEAMTLAIIVPRLMKQEKEFVAFSDCMIKAFGNTFHNGEAIIEDKVAKLKI